MTLYKIFGLIINAVAILLALSMVLSIPMIFSSPLTMLSAFMMIAIILYAWYSNQFNKKVLQQNLVVKKNLKDFIKVNGIVAIIFSLVIIVDIMLLIGKPETYVESLKAYGVDMPLQTIKTFFYIMLTYGIILLVHVIWTFTLLKKHAAFFK